MKLLYKILTLLGFICLMGFSVVNFISIEQLKKHHIEKYDKYSYAYDCIKEAELDYWDLKHQLSEEVQQYITSVAPASNLRGYALVEECERYDVDICFVLAQGEVESHFGTKGIASKTNSVFNVGAYDGLSSGEIAGNYKYNYPNESIEPYLKLLNTRYLVGKVEQDLMKKYVDINGKRYASNQNYEVAISNKYEYICTNTKIVELYALMKSCANKCGR